MRFIEVKDLEPGMTLARDIITPQNSFLLKKGVKLSIEYIRYLQNAGYRGAYIGDEISDELYIENTVSDEVFRKGVDAVKNVNIEGMIWVATEIVNEISTASDVSIDIYDLRSYDDYTYHHSVNVAVYATVVGKYLNYSTSKLNQLCQAAIYHDIGKTKIPLEVLNKPSGLTDEEFNLIKSHPKYSYEILSADSSVPAIVKQAVYMHHENENGTGYPLGKAGNEIPEMAKIIHVVDVYDALTSQRPYKKPYAATDAMEYLSGGVGILFDKDIVDVVRRVIPVYPLGVQVVLSNGREYLVVEHSNDNFRPVVMDMETKEQIDLSKHPDYQGVYIVKTGRMEADFAEQIETLNESRTAVKERTIRIAVVDDERICRMQTVNAIRGNYDFLEFGSGIEFIHYMKENPAPDLVLLDIEMPIIDGITVAKKLRAAGHKDMPIIFFSSRNDVQTVMACREQQAADYVLKPCQPAYLNIRVELALNHRPD